MITSKYKKVVRRRLVTDKVFCDWCEEQITDDFSSEAFGKVTIEFGYGSCYDEETFQYHICDRCFEILKNNMDKTRDRISKGLEK